MTAACSAQKSSNPLSPTVAGPIPGVVITAPGTMQPASGQRVAVDTQPITLMVNNAATTGVRPLSLRFEVATDANFANKVFTRDSVAPDPSGRTNLQLPEPLSPERAYFWRARAEDGANTGPFSNPVEFAVYTPIVFQPPTPTSPVNNVVVANFRPRFTFTNAPRTGPAGPVTYLIEVSDSAGFGNVVSATVAEQSGQTSIDTPSDLPANRQLFWHVRASEATTTGPWSGIAVFRTPATSGGGGGGGGGNPVDWTSQQWKDFVHNLARDRGFGTVSFAALANMRGEITSRGADWQNGWRGDYRPRIFLPVPGCPGSAVNNPNPPDCAYNRTVDLGDYGGPWQWIER